MVGGQSGFTFGRIIYSQFGMAYNWPFGAALSVILAGVVVLAISLGGRFGQRGERA
jgi:spermidine/putrescine transport system permease protein